MEVKISIIIPVYNVEKYLRECLDSVVNQTFKDIEIICIDDGSTDKSLEILQEYKRKDDRFVILQQRHAGAGAARNHGLKLAEGKYIQFLDSDDYFESTLLEELYTRAEKFGSDLTVCSSRKVDDEGNITETGSPNFPINIDKVPMEQVFSGQDFKDEIFCLLIPVVWNKLIKKSFLEENHLEFPQLTIYEYIAFIHSVVACANRIVAFNKELINYRFNRPGSLVSTRSSHTIEAIKSCMYLGEFLNSRNLMPEYENAYKKAMINHIRAEISYCNDDEYKEFLKEFKALLPNDWQKYQSALRKDYITPEYLKNFIGDKKVMLWGGSLFIKQVLEKEIVKNPNILGIIDRNAASAGKQFCNYTIYLPEAIYELKPDGVILTVLSNNESIYESLKQEFKEKYPKVELLPNIFEEELNMRIKNYRLNLKFLEQIQNSKSKKNIFWGASLFLEEFLKENPDIKNAVIGIVDYNKEKWNTTLEGLNIISPKSLCNQPVNIIFAVQNNYEKCYKEVFEYVSRKLPCAILKPNVFKEFYDEMYDSKNANITFLKPTQEEVDLLESLDDDYKPYSKMVNQDRLFLSTLVSRKKPKKILEVGVSSGGSSYIMLNALKNTDSHIYALDYNINHRDFEGKKCGFYIEENHPELKKQWTFLAGGLSLSFLDKIASADNEEDKFDFCFIDTAHITPCEILDTLQVLPYLKKNATLVFHDTNLHLYTLSHPAFKLAYLNNLLMSAVKGHKILPVKTNAKYVSSISDYVANIGAIELNESSFEPIYDIFNLLALEWYYMPNPEEILQLRDFFEHHYGNYWADYFMSVVEIQKVLFEKYGKTGML